MNLTATLMAGLLTAGAVSAGAGEIIAHRGASHEAPENTLAAFRLGYAQLADACELDVHLSRDGRVLVHHDRDTERTAGVKLTLAGTDCEELRRLELGQWGRWQGSAFAEKMPFLSEVLALVPAGRRLFIEIKVHEEILPELERVLRASGVPPRQLPLITFHLAVAKAAKLRLPGHEVCWLVGYGPDRQTGRFPDLDDLIRQAVAAGLDGLDLQGTFPIDAAFVRKVHAAGLKLYTWTVDDAAVARGQSAAGVDGITTNRPGWLREQLAARP